ncbi:MAG TPA: [FeFe] hydrogenase H-cluster radical SAM maturase HydE [Candidatus Margulisbacteria bacterium]|nr:MAG: [FeFe] hydrogenase H-cluster radical SAM maturase HydE [Candidatus Margulisbacteria bacterium GWF2_38_17]OGI10133.1 MAG: [FeFe] hydrogenase H-cluster radical SAM maturase HydE [Candidatus Margulisbacteria bacterium GWE2_39_32]HCT83592.1 [FeFe] hydrogenase H-cluster radical SAM maturase HydE [Candidatus Margulisiibacteriota bacterium]
MSMLEVIYEKVNSNNILNADEIVALLNTQGEDLHSLYSKSDFIRKQFHGDTIYLRGIIEFSNYCSKNCYYCGIRHDNLEVNRYRIAVQEIIEACKMIEQAGQTTVVLQSGEDYYFTGEIVGEIIAAIKRETGLAVTLSLGERDEEIYRYWKEMGMDRYLIRIETSDKALFEMCHPDDDFDQRLSCIKTLKKLGVQTGSGVLIGLPGQTIEQLARDILFCSGLDLDMIGVGPFIPHHNTPFANELNPFDKEVFFKVIAIFRLLNKAAHIPATTAYDAIHPHGRDLVLQRGANIFMPNSTPQKYRNDYQLYPGKPCVDESMADCASCVAGRIKRLGRLIGKDQGHSLKL